MQIQSRTLDLPSTMPHRRSRSMRFSSMPRARIRARASCRATARTSFAIDYATFAKRVAKLAHALVELGVRPGDRVASFAWNGHRHMELYYAVPMIGAVLHTVNIRLFPDQVAFILDHAEDRVVFFDASLAKAVKAFRALAARSATHVRRDGRADRTLRRCARLRDARRGETRAPSIGRRSTNVRPRSCAIRRRRPAIPKGVLFSHRSTYIHALASALCPITSERASAIAFFRSCRCFTSTRGVFRSSRRWSAPI